MADCIYCKAVIADAAKLCRHCGNVQPAALPVMAAHEAAIHRIAAELMQRASASRAANSGSNSPPDI